MFPLCLSHTSGGKHGRYTRRRGCSRAVDSSVSEVRLLCKGGAGGNMSLSAGTSKTKVKRTPFASPAPLKCLWLTCLPPFLFVPASLVLDGLGHGSPRPQEMSG